MTLRPIEINRLPVNCKSRSDIGLLLRRSQLERFRSAHSAGAGRVMHGDGGFAHEGICENRIPCRVDVSFRANEATAFNIALHEAEDLPTMHVGTDQAREKPDFHIRIDDVFVEHPFEAPGWKGFQRFRCVLRHPA